MTEQLAVLAKQRHDVRLHTMGPVTPDDPRDFLREMEEELADAWNYTKYDMIQHGVVMGEGVYWGLLNALQNAWDEVQRLKRQRMADGDPTSPRRD